MANDTTPCNIEDVRTSFVEAPKYIYQQIGNKIRKAKTLFTGLIPRGTFADGEGYIKYKEEFHGGLAIQDGGASWKVMAKFRAPLTNGPQDAGYDPCKSEALLVTVGTEEKHYTVYQTERRTEDVCLTDVKFNWQWEQQLALWYQSLAQISIAEWEQILSRAYERFCVKCVVRLSPLNTLTGLDTFTLTPAAGATFGGRIAIPAGGLGTIGVLNQSILDRLYAYLVRQVDEDGYLGMDSGAPLFGLAGSEETIGDIIKQDAAEVMALYWAKPSVNIEGYGQMRTYKNWVQYNDWNATRYKVSADGLWLEAVYPYSATPTTIGDAINVDAEYLNAPFEASKVIIRNVFQANVPPPNPSSVSGFKFDPYSNVLDWEFMNIQERCDNPRREKGFFLARGRMAPEPGANSAYCIEILHRRCTVPTVAVCGNCDSTDATPLVTAVVRFDLTVAAALTKKWILTLNGCLDCQIGDRITATVTDVGAGNHCGVIVDNLAGTTIVVVFDTAFDYGAATLGDVTCGCTERQ